MKAFGTAAILAGGKSKRMGFDKQRIKIGDEWLIDRLHRMLSEHFEQVMIISQTPELYKESSYEVYPDRISGGGPLAGIHSALEASQSRYVFVIACDMTRIDAGLIAMMKDRLSEGGQAASVACYGDWIEPFHAFYSIEMRETIASQLSIGIYKISKCLEHFRVDYVPETLVRQFTPDWDLFVNLNARSDLRAYRRKLDEDDSEH